jgi:type II secretory pathway pseudopilin PulG
LVIGIIAILAGIVIVAINPSKQLATVRNTERKSDLKQIYNAITQYYIDNSAYPSTISTTTLNEVCNTGSVASTANAVNGASCGTLANLSVLVPTYLTAIPTDPTGTSSLLSFIPTAYAATTATGTGYKVGINTAKQVLISAPLAELGVRVVVGNVPTTVAATDCLATGGVIDTTSAPGYKIHTFTTSGAFVATRNCNVEVLVVAGGGAGGLSNAGNGGGGGAGGLRYNSSFPVSQNSYTVTVGNGGLASGASNGGDSVFSTLTAIGGGRGGSYESQDAQDGGSGGGRPQCGTRVITGRKGLGTLGQGYDGGGNYTFGTYGGGGGGGSSQVGAPQYGGAPNNPEGGYGGNGTAYSISGASVYYAGGGAGSSHGIATQGVPQGGLGGGGNGHYGAIGGQDGLNGTGGGGGGGGEYSTNGAGGSGIVIVRYAI